MKPALRHVLQPAMAGALGSSRQLTATNFDSLASMLFAASEPGLWLDPSDLSTMFQDSAGTTPVTAVEQPVGLILDKSRGLVLGPELVTGGGFDDPANWTSTAWTVSAGVATYPDTINDFIRPANANLLPLVAGKAYCVSFTLSGVTGSAVCAVTNADGSVAYTAITSFTTNGAKQFIIYAAVSTTNIRFYGYTSSGGTWSLDNISVRELPGNHASQATTPKRPLLSARVNLLLGTATLATQSITTLAASHRLTFSGAGSITLSGTASGVFGAGTHTIACTAGTLTLTVAGTVNDADFRLAIDANLPYQWVNTPTDYDASAAGYYLRFDGVDDALQTGNIDFTGTDKMTVWAGVTKLSDAAAGVVCELSPSISSSNGAFALLAPVSGSNYGSYSKGTVMVQAISGTGRIAPHSSVLTGIGDISGDRATLRELSVQTVQMTTDQGTGNYGNYALHIGARAGTSLYFNGRLYPLIIRGAQSSLSQIEATEVYTKQKMRLP